MAQATTTAKFATTHTEDTRLYVLAFAIVVAAEFIGIVNFSVGPGKIVLLPMLWALLIGGVWSMAESWLPGPLQIGTALQRRASAIVQLAVLLFAAKLGLLVGGSLPKLATAGWALLFQEFGHYSGNRIIPAMEPRGRVFGRMSHSPSHTWRNNRRAVRKSNERHWP